MKKSEKPAAVKSKAPAAKQAKAKAPAVKKSVSLHSDGLKQMKHLYRELDPALQTHVTETTLKKMMAQVHKIEREGHAVNRLEDAEKAAPSASIKKAILDADKQEIGQLYKLDTEEKSVQHGDKDDEKYVSGMLKELTAVKGLDEEELNLE